jgi:hypothetical protein
MTENTHGRRSNETGAPADRRNPGQAYLQREIDDNRRGEFALLWKTALALLFVAVLVAIRVIFFS